MSRSTKLLLLTFVVLAVLAYFLLPSGSERETSYKLLELRPAIDSATVVKIEIQRPGQSLSMENIGGVWTITSPKQYKADASAVAHLIGNLTRLRSGSLVSSNPERQGVYQVDSTGMRVTLTDRSGKSVDLIVGKSGPSYTEVYYRFADSKDVYLGGGIETWRINQDVKAWRDRNIYSVDSDSIRELVLTYRGRSFTLRRDSTTWRAGRDTIAATVMSSVLSALTNLNASDFVDTLYQPKTHPFGLKVRTSDETALQLYPIPPDTASYFVQSSRTSQGFILTKWIVKDLLKPMEQLAK